MLREPLQIWRAMGGLIYSAIQRKTTRQTSTSTPRNHMASGPDQQANDMSAQYRYGYGPRSPVSGLRTLCALSWDPPSRQTRQYAFTVFVSSSVTAICQGLRHIVHDVGALIAPAGSLYGQNLALQSIR